MMWGTNTTVATLAWGLNLTCDLAHQAAQTRKDWYVSTLAGLLGLLAYARAFFDLREPIGFDWGYFNALALVVRSNFKVFGTFPLHDPFVGGGLDILANPQSRVFSLMGLLDLAFVPYIANLLSLALYAAVGSIAMFWLLRKKGIKRWLALFGAGIFIHGSWFALHAAEGHVPFGAIQTLPLIGLLILNIEKKICLWFLCLLFVQYLLDGAMYAFVFGCYFVAHCFLLMESEKRNRFFESLLSRKNLLFHLSLAFGCFALASAKLFPALYFHASRPPETALVNLSHALGRIFFNPNQDILFTLPGIPWRFHELGCYLGVSAVFTSCLPLLHSGFRKDIRADVLSCAFWFVVACGLFGTLNPWGIHEAIPLFNKVHVQSRCFVIFYFFFVVWMVRAVQFLSEESQGPRMRAALAMTVVCILGEQAFVHDGVWRRFFSVAQRTESLVDLIPVSARGVVETVKHAPKPGHYLGGSLSAVATYEPARVATKVVAKSEPHYRGEAYVLLGLGIVDVVSFRPGVIRLRYNVLVDSVVQVNTNFLGGWKIATGEARVLSNKANDLITLSVRPGTGYLELIYRPGYLVALFTLVPLGLVLVAFSLFLVRQQPQSQAFGEAVRKAIELMARGEKSRVA